MTQISEMPTYQGLRAHDRKQQCIGYQPIRNLFNMGRNGAVEKAYEKVIAWSAAARRRFSSSRHDATLLGCLLRELDYSINKNDKNPVNLVNPVKKPKSLPNGRRHAASGKAASCRRTPCGACSDLKVVFSA